MRNKNIQFPVLILIMLTSLLACTKQEYKIPDPVSQLTNDCIKRTIGPSIVGLPLEFAYAMALPKLNGKLVSAQVEANYAGAAGTYLEHR